MSYLIEDDLLADLPAAFLEQALTDGPAGSILFETLAKRASDRADAILVQRFEVPIAEDNQLYLIAKEAARTFALDSCYKRRGYPDENNPWFEEAKIQTQKLKSLVNKKETAPAGSTNSKRSASAVTAKAKTDSTRNSI